MACCDRNHVVLDAEGVPQPIPCMKDTMASIMLTLLRSLREYHFGRDELLSYRMFTALMPLLMSGLPSDVVEHRNGVSGLVAQHIPTGRRGRPPRISVVEPNHVEATLIQLSDEPIFIGDPRAAEPVHEQQRLAAPEAIPYPW